MVAGRLQNNRKNMNRSGDVNNYFLLTFTTSARTLVENRGGMKTQFVVTRLLLISSLTAIHVAEQLRFQLGGQVDSWLTSLMVSWLK